MANRGTKFDQIRWTLEKVQVEIGINNRTLSKRIRALGLTPDIDGKYFTTRQVIAACFGDYEGERLREVRAKADGLEIDNARKRGELLETAEVRTYWAGRIVLYKQWLMNQKQYSEDQKRDLLLNFSMAMEPDTVAESKPKPKRAKRKVKE